MPIINGHVHVCCEDETKHPSRLSRRELLTIGGLGTVGAGLAGLLPGAARVASSATRAEGPKHVANPVLTPGPDAWDARNVLHCSIVRDEAGFKLYYTGETTPGYEFRSIGLALSDDGIHWKKHPGNPLITPSRNITSDESDNVHCHTPTVLYRRAGGPRYQMWYSGYQNNSGNRIGYAASDDGLHWVRRREPVLDYGKPGEFDDRGLRSPNVIIHPDTGEYWMYYNGTRPEQHYGPTGLAVSRDGIRWEKRGQLSRDESRLLYGEVVYDPAAKLFRMWHDLGPAITYAVSRDGVRWQDLDGPPLIQPGEPYDRGYCQAPSVLYDSKSRSYWVYYNGATSGDAAKEHVTINLAVFSESELDKLRFRGIASVLEPGGFVAISRRSRSAPPVGWPHLRHSPRQG